ncbi:STAS-like domain-containing protein [Pseudomonas sp. CFBP 13719]|uniref:STAS-like domain-containing protein n=1 Tax=Pseudomonas sp. CFBP 13719 TaxID=2775303 RepID=UPI0017800304|nr:STAS-like domain-containing protein [Pseudomonas sp. CFBP 13719]MBD8685032.1 STAS-like domain-containing protein [Pseudomonas sp. CFBP 13719]
MEAYTFQRTDLASRSLAAQERATIETLLQNSDMVNVDLGRVSSISESYADELFGVLVLQRGLEYVTKHLRIINAADNVLRPIAVAMKRRTIAA